MTHDASRPLDIEITQVDSDLWRVKPVGELGRGTSETFPTTLAELTTQGASRIVVDLSGVSFIDSTGINALVVSCDTVSTAGGAVIFAAPSEQTARLFELLRLTDVVTVEESLDAALARAMATNDEPR